MKKSGWWVCVAWLTVLGGCVPSVHPLYTEGDLVFDPALVGEWTGKEGKDAWRFAKEGEKAYTLAYVDDKGKEGTFSVHLLEAGGQRFLDFYPTEPVLKENDFYKIHVMSVHTFMRVSSLGPVLQLEVLNLDVLKKMLVSNPESVRHETESDRIILTAPPKELQAFLLANGQTKDFWSEIGPLTRKAGAGPSTP